MVDLSEHAHNTAMVNTGDENGEQVGEKSRLFGEVESERFIVTRIMSDAVQA